MGQFPGNKTGAVASLNRRQLKLICVDKRIATDPAARPLLPFILNAG